MAGKMTIPIVRDTGYAVGDRVELEIDGQVQPDLIYLWLNDVTRDEAIAAGSAEPLLHQTVARFGAGDYSVRLRGVDARGNPSAWMAAQVIEHRPVPETPAGLELSGGVLSGSWVEA